MNRKKLAGVSVQRIHQNMNVIRNLSELTFIFQIDESGRIVLMENGGVPWKEHFFDLEEELVGLFSFHRKFSCLV